MLYIKGSSLVSYFIYFNKNERPLHTHYINYNDKLDWMILEEIASEIPWFYAEKKGMIFHFQTPEYHGRHDCEIFFQTHLTGKLSHYGLDCYNVTYSRD